MLALLASLGTLCALLATTSSSSLLRRQTQEYHLQSKCVSCANDKGTHKGGLYIESYHTGAGLSDAVFTKNVSMAARGYLNGTMQQFDLQDNAIWYLAMGNGSDSEGSYAGASLTF